MLAAEGVCTTQSNSISRGAVTNGELTAVSLHGPSRLPSTLASSDLNFG